MTSERGEGARRVGPAPVVSVVVPVHDKATYLDECLASLRAQTLADFEAVCVDDGSTDGSAEILARHAAADPRLVVLTQPCRGVGAARNAGLERARGRFVAFLDADDALAPEALGRLVGVAAERGADIVKFDYATLPAPGGESAPHLMYDDPALRGRTFALRDVPYACTRLWMTNVWTGLYDAALVRDNGLRFPEDMSNGEDMAFLYEALACARAITVCREPLYRYREGVAGGLSHEVRAGSVLRALGELGRFHDGLYLRDEGLRRQYVNLAVDMVRYELDATLEPGAFAALHEEVRRDWLPLVERSRDLVDEPLYGAYVERLRTATPLGYALGNLAAAREALGAADERAARAEERAGAAEREVEALRADERAVRGSYAFRVGRALTWLPSRIRAALRGRGHGE